MTITADTYSTPSPDWKIRVIRNWDNQQQFMEAVRGSNSVAFSSVVNGATEWTEAIPHNLAMFAEGLRAALIIN